MENNDLDYINTLDEIAQLIANSQHLVIFTGAGISTESGLADYRGPDGVWTRRDKGLKPKPGPLLNEIFPNNGHQAIKDLQELGVLKLLISQNVDNLHLRSEIRPELISELHGNHSLMKCLNLDCDTRFTKKEIHWNDQKFGHGYRTQKSYPNQPTCPICGGRIISSIINFNDPMPEKELDMAFKHSKMSDIFIVIGSTLLVQPAAALPKEALKNGAKLIIINKGETPYDMVAHHVINANSGEVLQELLFRIKKLMDNTKL